MVSGLCHVSLCCCVGRGPAWGGGQLLCGQPDEEVLLCCAFVALQWLLRGRGRGATGWILPGPTLEQVLPWDAVWGLCKQNLHGAGVLMPHSALVQSRLDCTVNLVNNGKSLWLPRCLLRERLLFRHIQLLARPLLSSFLLHFPP